MQLAKIIGHATSTVKHSSLDGWRLMIAQPLGASEQPDGDPIIVIDNFSCGRGDRVIFTSEGNAVREMVGSRATPVRFAVLGRADT